MARTRSLRAASPTPSPGASLAGGRGVRERAARQTRESILKAAIRVFSKHGFSGGSVEKISTAARSYDRMIYYYFGSKEGLFIAALEEIYRRFHEAESSIALDLDRPVTALRSLVDFALTYYREHPEFVTLLNSENLYRGRHISGSLRAQEYSQATIGVVASVLDRGVRDGLFRPEVRPRDLYLLIAATGYFYQSNRFTLSAFLGEDLEGEAARQQWARFVQDAVLRVVLRDPQRLLA